MDLSVGERVRTMAKYKVSERERFFRQDTIRLWDKEGNLVTRLLENTKDPRVSMGISLLVEMLHTLNEDILEAEEDLGYGPVPTEEPVK